MENATKALIIAGAILVAILLVTMGITLLGNTKGLSESSANKMSDLEIKEFNGQIEIAIGNNSTGSSVISMLENIQAKWRTNEDLAEDMTLTCLGSTCSDANSIDTAISNIRTTRRYTVTATKNANTGLYNVVTITQNT